MMRRVRNIHVLVRNEKSGVVSFLLSPHPRWSEEGHPVLSLPAKKVVADPGAERLDGTSVEGFVDRIMREDLGVAEEDYALDQELERVSVEMDSPTHGDSTRYDIYPVDVHLSPERRRAVKDATGGVWLTAFEAAHSRAVSPTAVAVFDKLLEREVGLNKRYQEHPEEERKPEAPRRLLTGVPERPTMDMLAKKWHARNRGGVRHLAWKDLQAILDSGNRAFNLLVADPYLRYQNQGNGLTWSFFTEKDRQDLHLHGEPTVEIYGVRKGRLELWSKPYHDRGVCAWSRHVLEPGDSAEVRPMTCHIVRWLEPGVGEVIKGGPGPLAGVGKIGVCGKTPCEGCPCIKPPEVVAIQKLNEPQA